MIKIFQYECKRLLWNKFFFGLLLILLFYGWQVLNSVTILGVSHTAPFSPWSFGDYLSRMIPLLWIGALFFLTFFTSGKAQRVNILTDATPVSPRRYALKATINTKEVYKLGNPVVGHKAQTMALAFSMTIYKCTEIFDTVVERFLKTGVMPTFTVQTSNDDPATSVGRSTKIYNDCILDGDVLLSMFNSEGDFVEQSIEGYCDSFTRPEQHTNPAYM